MAVRLFYVRVCTEYVGAYMSLTKCKSPCRRRERIPGNTFFLALRCRWWLKWQKLESSSRRPALRMHAYEQRDPVVKCNFCSWMRLTKLQCNLVGQTSRMMKPSYRISCIVVETCSSFEEQLITAISTCFDSITDMNSDCKPTTTIANVSSKTLHYHEQNTERCGNHPQPYQIQLP